MKNRSRLAWLGALALILVVPPVASSVAGDLGAASKSSEQKQNQRLDRHTRRLNKHAPRPRFRATATRRRQAPRYRSSPRAASR